MRKDKLVAVTDPSPLVEDVLERHRGTLQGVDGGIVRSHAQLNHHFTPFQCHGGTILIEECHLPFTPVYLSKRIGNGGTPDLCQGLTFEFG
ncbi:hypothetical protein D3C77_617850 [compost metagenome]